jgi:hypothetical protein
VLSRLLRSKIRLEDAADCRYQRFDNSLNVLRNLATFGAATARQ